jgi:Zn-finger nucleic acid-binding protein
MEQVEFGGVEVDRCTGCQGLWFDAFEDRDLRRKPGSEKLDTGSAKAGEKRDAQGKINCPRDGASMIRMVDRDQPHVWYESCSVCYGVFLDAGEFRDLKQRSIGDLFRRLRKGERPLT